MLSPLLQALGGVAAHSVAGLAAATEAAAAGLTAVNDVDVASAPSSLFDTIALKTRALFSDELNSSLAQMVANTPLVLDADSSAKAGGVSPLAAAAATLPLSSAALSSLLPSESTLFACALALLLYVVSWTALGARGMHISAVSDDDNDERNKASFDARTAKHNKITQMEAQSGLQTRSPAVVRGLRALCSVFVFAWRCGVFVWHFFLNRICLFRTPSVYLRGFTCASMPDDWTVTTERFRRTALQNFGLADKSVEFCMKLLGRSGLGEQVRKD
jgi:hypothetical protein